MTRRFETQTCIRACDDNCLAIEGGGRIGRSDEELAIEEVRCLDHDCGIVVVLLMCVVCIFRCRCGLEGLVFLNTYQLKFLHGLLPDSEVHARQLKAKRPLAIVDSFGELRI